MSIDDRLRRAATRIRDATNSEAVPDFSSKRGRRDRVVGTLLVTLAAVVVAVLLRPGTSADDEGGSSPVISATLEETGLELHAVYLPASSPAIGSVTVRNGGTDTVDLSGWSLVSRGREGLVFPQGTLLGPGQSIAVFQQGAGGVGCDDPPVLQVGLTFVVCFDHVRGPRAPFGGSTIELRNAQGDEITRWAPSPGETPRRDFP